MNTAVKQSVKDQLAAIQKYMVLLGKLHPYNPEKPRLVEPKASHKALNKFLDLLRVRGALREQVRELAAQLARGGIGEIQTKIAALAPEDMQKDLRWALMQFEGERRLCNFLLDLAQPSGGRRFEPLRD